MKDLEEGLKLTLDFSKLSKIASTGQAVVPVVLQHADTGDVLYIGYANDLALSETLKTGKAVLWSTSRNELWRKGETSGDVLDLVDVRVNCEQNSVLYRLRPRKAGACHTKDADGNTRSTCYYRLVLTDGETLEFP
jgi:phosphoribosyl-AMP cyclohydrolase